jgi:hypothetical protein
VFRAQAWQTGVDVWEAQSVTSITAVASTYVNFAVETDGFAGDSADISIDVTMVATGTPIFVSEQDSHLMSGTMALDAGHDPVDYGFAGGVSFDGVDRQGRDIDQGCYE